MQTSFSAQAKPSERASNVDLKIVQRSVNYNLDSSHNSITFLRRGLIDIQRNEEIERLNDESSSDEEDTTYEESSGMKIIQHDGTIDWNMRESIHSFAGDDSLQYEQFLGRKMVLYESDNDEDNVEHNQGLMEISDTAHNTEANQCHETNSTEMLMIIEGGDETSTQDDDIVVVPNPMARNSVVSPNYVTTMSDDSDMDDLTIVSIYNNDPNRVLKDYQVDGVEFLYNNFLEGRNSCLSDR